MRHRIGRCVRGNDMAVSDFLALHLALRHDSRW